MKKYLYYDETESKKLIMESDALEALTIFCMITIKDRSASVTMYDESGKAKYSVTGKVLDNNCIRVTFKDIESDTDMLITMVFSKDRLFTEVMTDTALVAYSAFILLKKTIEQQPGFDEMLTRIKSVNL